MAITHADNTISKLSDQSIILIIGLTNINDNINLYSTSSDSKTPSKSVGQIWKITYIILTNFVLNATNNKIDSMPIFLGGKHLVYIKVLKFSTFYRIEAKGIYENRTKANVYWTDNFDQLRSINVNDHESYDIKPEDIDIKAYLTKSAPVIIYFGSGSFPTCSMILVKLVID